MKAEEYDPLAGVVLLVCPKCDGLVRQTYAASDTRCMPDHWQRKCPRCHAYSAVRDFREATPTEHEAADRGDELLW